MKGTRKLFSILTALALCLSLCPAPALAAGDDTPSTQAAGTPTRTEQLDLSTMSATDKTSEEGWKWEPDANGGTLTLTNCHIQSPNTKIIILPNTGNTVYTIILNGNNILETTSTVYNPMIAAATPVVVGTFNVRSGQSGGSLELLASNAKTDGSNNPYGFAGQHFTFENTTIKSNVDLAIFDQDFTMKNCGLTINGAETAYCGIYSVNGPIKIYNSDIDISVPQGAFFIDCDSTSNIKERSIEISGGTARLSGGYGFFMTQVNYSKEELTNSVKLSNGAKVNCEKGGFYGADLTLEGEGTEMILAGRYYMYHSLSNKISIGEGTILTLNGSETVATGGSAPPTIENNGDFIISRAGWIENSEELTLSGNGGFYCTALSGSTTIEDSVYSGADQKDSLNISTSGSAIIKETEFLPLSAKNVSNCTFERQDGDTWSTVIEIKDAGTYRASYDGNVIDTFSIAPKPLTVTGATATSRAYDGTKEVVVTAVTLGGVLDADSGKVSVDTTNLKGTIDSAGVGTYTSVTLPELTLTGAAAGNYTLTQPIGAVSTSVTIAKGAYAGTKTAETSGRFGVSKTFDLGSLLPDGAAAGAVAVASGSDIFTETPSVSGGVLSYTLVNDEQKVGGTAEVKVTVSSSNYADFDFTITVTVADKYVPTLTVSPITVTYTGEAVPDSAIQGTAKVGDTTISGIWSFTAGQALTAVADSGEKTIKFTPDEAHAAEYAEAEGTVMVTIAKATPTGTPTYTAISAGGKTLADAGLTAPAGWPAGTLSWSDADTTEVTANAQYQWTFTPADTDNYNTLTGEITLWTQSSGGSTGGGGSSRPSLPVTTDKSTENGTTTTDTTAKPSATVKGDTASATVSGALGSEIVKQAEQNKSDNVVIAPEIKGDVAKTEVSIPASTVGEIGSRTQASLTISTPVADVTIPNGGLASLASEGGTISVTAEVKGDTVELTVTADGETVQSVPGGMTVTVPAKGTKPGTVAMLVHEDGTQEVIRKSVAGEASVTIPLDGSAKLEIVDNSKTFADVPDSHWASDAVAFASARELFRGTAPDTFSPSLPMSRGMLAVVLHNLENNPAQTLTGAFADVDDGHWYAEGVAWATSQGIVSGYGDRMFGPNDNITREQLAVMLWRYAGSPAAAGKELHFTDADRASGWALEALRWAVENGVINGKGGGILDPQGLATRAQVAQMLMNFLKNK